jgi:hypothetical protein
VEFESSLAHYWLAENLTLAGDLRGAVAHYEQYFYLTRLMGADEPMDDKYGRNGRSSFDYVSRAKLVHDIEQYEYLTQHGKVDADTREVLLGELEHFQASHSRNMVGIW